MKKIMVVLFVVLVTSLAALADSGSMSKSCQGAGYTISAAESATVNGTTIFGEKHTFTFTGIYAADQNAQLMGVTDNWLIFQGQDHYLGIPWHDQYPLLSRAINSGTSNQWTTVCP